MTRIAEKVNQGFQLSVPGDEQEIEFMNNEQARLKAIQVLRRRVRFKSAAFRLPESPTTQDDTPAIIEATMPYMSSWVVPLLDCLESGDFSLVRRYYQFEPGDPMDKEAAERDLFLHPERHRCGGDPRKQHPEHRVSEPSRE